MTQVPVSKSNLADIRALVLDVDGVLTDGGLWWGPNGEEWKRFCFADIMGLSLARRAGLVFALISGEDSPLVDRFARKLQIKHVVKGCRDKASALSTFALETNIDLNQICFMGDDVNDLAAMAIAGYAAATANAAQEVLNRAAFVARRNGGNGAVRDWVDAFLAARGMSGREMFASAPSAESQESETRKR
jgi:3-deoxy-D-manno-octulosonate 8-phosphate phosphatase (KDO 8-P phosphatase)